MDAKTVIFTALLFALAAPSFSHQPVKNLENGAEAANKTLYDVYNEGGIINPNGSALIAEGSSFTLNGKDFHIFSGAIHYFRVVPEYWRDRIRKLKASGCNTLETYVAWNLHEELPGKFNFQDNLDIRTYLQIAKEEDVFVILRPGPYICSEWDFGGMPSWLLRNTDIQLRTSDAAYEAAIQAYYQQLIPLLTDLQFTYGGPIIAVQVENEYGSFGVDDQDYLLFLKGLMENLGIVELFATSDSCGTDECRQHGSLPGVLMTSNFNNNPDYELDRLERLQPGRPLMVMEYWSGWYDIWGQNHNTVDVDYYAEMVTEILNRNASLSFYMFHGGTNFGFTNGANADSVDLGIYLPIVTSYDYDSPLTEAGDYTPKYNKTKELILNYSKGRLWDVALPDPPPETPKAAYGDLQIINALSLDQMLALVTPQSSPGILPMELLDVYGNAGQSFGFILYETTVDVADGSVLTILGRARDYAKIILDGLVIATAQYKNENFSINFSPEQVGSQKKLQILVENSGHVNFGVGNDFAFHTQAKGLLDPVVLDDVALANWNIYPLDFNETFINSLTSAPWSIYDASDITYPALLKTVLNVEDDPEDTFINLSDWTKGIVVLNNVVLGRHWNIGPQHTLYIPAPFLQTGDNLVYIFELEGGSGTVTFQDTPILG